MIHDVTSSALTCISAIVMVVTLVIGNHWRGQHIWGEVEDPATQTKVAEKTMTASISSRIFLDEEQGSFHASADASSDSKGYVIVKEQKEATHRRSLTMNDAGRNKNSFLKSNSKKLLLTIPEEQGNHLLLPMTNEEKIDNINEFFEELFNSIDYSILLIFMGMFSKENCTEIIA